ncbi:hypothetical protein G3N56_06335 [Desulfovibrio sulfodismutans]|uniref:Uncharacterized protein n=1 Tax=Desulfolutivibrio sulfodismutans TaxID=63561 RepID=A0A7K3NJL0_9BACT|nr:hypothetical protein [Desulfolutivibrio sulfodismutans]NDY56360.1 hypothetical protein [Desulfolutivibrio sulfodismutans]QLA13467.1 hypothetical protein GD606_14945 [Desulfolutivibrio sulfodismutans DSM 3696]
MPTDHSGLVARLGRLTAAALAALVLWLPARACLGQTALEDVNENSKYYLLTLSGLAGKKSFQGVRGMLVLSAAPPDSNNNYVVTINGWPEDNGVNTFVWNSKDSQMESLSGRMTCRIANSYSVSPNIFFFHLSPALFKREGMLTQREGERIRQVLKEALPTKVQAVAGELTLDFTGQQVTGQVWMNGYDFVEKANVRYRATFQGELTGELKSSRRVRNHE